MIHYKLVLPEHLNHYGTLFGGNLLKWIDEVAFMTAKLEFPGHRFVTVAMDHVEFRNRVERGEILKFQVEQVHIGHTSVRYHVNVLSTENFTHPDTVLIETSITFVNIDTHGNKQPIKIQS